jgi:acyl carrier protein
VELDEIPLSVNGKVDRRALPAPAAQRVAQFVAAAGHVESTIAGIWANALGVERVGTSENFFDLGGHSLLLASIQGQLQRQLGKRLSYIDLFRHPTVASLAQLFDDTAADTGDKTASARERAQRQRAQLNRQKDRRRPRGG